MRNKTVLFHAGGPDLHGVIEKHGCCRWRLLPAVCGTADVTGRDDGNVLTKLTAHVQAVTASFTYNHVIIAVLVSEISLLSFGFLGL